MMESSVNPGMCRCCASEGAFKDIKSTYHWMGEEEIYADMLRECFDIILNASEQGQDGGICEVCITQLRNAINFKKQVLHTEEQFQKHLQNKTLFRPHIVKVEVEAEDDSEDNMGSGDDAFSGAEFEVPIKTEIEEPKPKKRAAKASATTTRASAKKAKSDNGETSSKRRPQEDTVEIKIGVDKPVEAKKGDNIPVKSASKGVTNLEAAGSSKPPVSRGYNAEINKHKTNIMEIMRWSNATPIKLWGDMGYMCCYCEDQYLEPADLKAHTLQAHENVTKAYFIKDLSMYNYIIKLDITDLQCKICKKSIDTSEELMDHLKNEHNKNIDTDIKNHIVPLKFNTKALECFICKNVFHRFKLLVIHMNTHYRNYICDICQAGYVNYCSLRLHKATHKTENFTCSSCSMKFETLTQRNLHLKTKHAKTVNHKCGYCNEKFNNYRKKEAHLISVHGQGHQKSKCQACDKEFNHRKQLAVHVKRDHLMIRPHACEVCEKTFFTPHELKNHMTKHSRERPYKCEICLKSYRQSRILKQHMKIHNDDRRFKCVHCGQAFIQKSILKCHMKSKHGEIV